MARRLPGGGIFRGTYAPKAISYDKPQADYMKMLQAGEKILPVADKILTPLLYDAVTGVTSAVGSLFKGGTEKVQQDIASSQSDNRSKVANKMLGNVPDVTLEKPELIKDTPETPKQEKGPLAVERTINLKYVTELLSKAGDSPNKPRYLERYGALLNKLQGTDFPEEVLSNLTPENIKRLVEDPTYYGKDLLIPDLPRRNERFMDPPLERRGRRAPETRRKREGEELLETPSPTLDQVKLKQSVQPSTVRPGFPGEFEETVDDVTIKRGKLLDSIQDTLIAGHLKQGIGIKQATELSSNQLYDFAQMTTEQLEDKVAGRDPEREGQALAARFAPEMAEAEADLEKQMARFPRAGTELAQEQEQQLDEAKESFETQVKSAEDAVKVVARQPGGERAMRSFEQGYVQQVQDMPFTQVRAITSLSDPSRLSSAQVSALAERYRNEATPKSITSLISGEYLQEADKRFTKDFGRYGGFASAKERANIIAQREAMERERYKQGESFKRQTRTIDEQRKQFERVQTREEAADLSTAELNVATKALRESQALLNKQKKTTEVRRAQKLFLESQAISRKLNGGFGKGRSRGKFLPAFIQGKLVQIWQGRIGNKIERLVAGSERFQQLVQTRQIKLSKAQSSLLKSYYGGLEKSAAAANKALLAKQEIADALPGKIKAARAEYAAVNGAAREIYGDRLNFSPSGRITIDPPTKEELAERKALEGILGLDPEGAEDARTKEIQDRLKMTKKLNDTYTTWDSLQEQFLKLRGSSKDKEKQNKKKRAEDAAKSLESKR